MRIKTRQAQKLKQNNQIGKLGTSLTHLVFIKYSGCGMK